MDSIGSYGSGSSIDYAKMRQEMFTKVDSDGDGQLSLEEFDAAKPADAPEDSSSKIFAEMDSDGDGYVTEEEFANAPPPPPPPGGGGSGAAMDDETLSSLLQALEELTAESTDEDEDDDSDSLSTASSSDESDETTTTETDLLELIQQELERYQKSAFSQAQNAYAEASGLGSVMVSQYLTA